MARHRGTRPGLFARLFRTAAFRAWSLANAPLLAALRQADAAADAADRAMAEAQASCVALDADVAQAQRAIGAERATIATLERTIATHRRTLGDRIVDDGFFAAGDEPSHLAAPWIPDSLHRKREDLFIAAMDTHRAFIDVAAQKVLHNSAS